MDPEILTGILSAVMAAGGAWGAVRYELGRTKERADTAWDAAQRAHQRIDQLHQEG